MKVFFFLLALLSLGLGVLGIFLPLLPTTPFLLVAAFFFVRSSDRMYTWLIGHPVLGRYIRDYLRYRAISRRAKIVSIASMDGMIAISLMLVHSRMPPFLWIAFAGAGALGSFLILRIPPLEKKRLEAAAED
ncbi:MAG: YbaN family protein [Spirochaetales bacterium]|nr:YbaN family protein [Spirochaetales bacterium]MCF7938896.1 YbaN family protein [Spirochaetales bacterium]